MNILIGDDHSVVRRGLKAILGEAYPNADIEEAIDGSDLLKKAVSREWQIIISDITMPDLSGLEVVKKIKELKPRIPVLILSIHSAEHYATRVLKAGAAGYLTKESATEELVNAVKHIISGRKYITPEIAEMFVDQHMETSKTELHKALSDREFEVLKLIASGKTSSEIADMLVLSINTISTYRSRILEKMRMANNAELTKYAISKGLA